MNIETVNEVELLKELSWREGFVVQFTPPSKITDTESINNSLIKAGIIGWPPEKVYSFQNILIFVMAEGATFKAKQFFDMCEATGRMTGMWTVDHLQTFIKAIP